MNFLLCLLDVKKCTKSPAYSPHNPKVIEAKPKHNSLLVMMDGLDARQLLNGKVDVTSPLLHPIPTRFGFYIIFWVNSDGR